MVRARPSRLGKRLGWRGVAASRALAAALTVAVAVTVAVAPPVHAAPAGIGTRLGAASSATGKASTGKAAEPIGGATCGKAVGPFKVSGTQVLDASGKPFVSYGLTMSGLQGTSWARWVGMDLEEIAAAAADWCVNTVRLQVDQDSLIGPDGTGFNQAYLAAIEAEVSLAESYNLVVVLNDETNFSAPAVQNSERGPTPATEIFWKDLAKLYGNDPQVIFDLFNEPRMYSAGMSQAQEWHLWLDGGSYNGVDYPFGMARLAAYVRTTVGARNLFWIEGPDFSASFAGMVQQGALLDVSGVVYALHHPAGQPDPTSWDDDFGYLFTDGIAPVVDGEWTNYEPAPTAYPITPPTSCWPDAPTAVPAFLKYLAQYGIGLNAYTLQPGYLIQSYTNLDAPTTINAKTWTCQSDSEMQPDQSAGSEVLAWFEQQNG
jgi:Cellulase (glycosyl hydrolase family 5)